LFTLCHWKILKKVEENTNVWNQYELEYSATNGVKAMWEGLCSLWNLLSALHRKEKEPITGE